MQPAIADVDPHAAPIVRRDTKVMEHRFGRRFRCGTAVRVSSDGGDGPGRLANVSLSGAFVQTALDLPPFSVIAVVAHMGDRKVELRGCVVRKNATGVGIEWCETPSRSICRIFGCTKHCEAL